MWKIAYSEDNKFVTKANKKTSNNSISFNDNYSFRNRKHKKLIAREPLINFNSYFKYNIYNEIKKSKQDIISIGKHYSFKSILKYESSTLSNTITFEKQFSYSLKSIREVSNRFLLSVSCGIYPIEEHIYDLIRDYEYDYYNNLLKNKSKCYYWFDSSMPSIVNYAQTKVVPTGQNNQFVQFSLNFPEYDFSLEANITGIDSHREVNAEFSVGVAGEELYMEMIKVFPSSAKINTEFNIKSEFLYPLPVEFKKVFYASSNTDIEFRRIFNSDPELCIEFNNPFINKAIDTNIEFRKIYNTTINLPVELKVPKKSNSQLVLETNSTINKNYELNLEMWSEQEVNDNVEIELVKVEPSNEDISIEYNVEKIKTFEKLFIEANINKINKEISVPIEFRRVYKTNENIDIEIDTSVNTSEILNMQFYPIINDSIEATLEMLAPFYVNALSQSKIISFGYNAQFAQIMLISISKEELVLEFNIEHINNTLEIPVEFKANIIIDEKTNIEFDIEKINEELEMFLEANTKIVIEPEVGIELKTQKNTEESINIEIDSSIPYDAEVTLETDTCISNDKELAIEYVQEEDSDENVEIETSIHIDTDEEISMETNIEKININKELSIQIDTIINTSIDIGIEYAVATINEKLGLEFDILDLVYYMLKNGYNAIPYWSDGLGEYNKDADKKWIKNENTTDPINSICEQLNDLDVEREELISIFDNKTELFSTIIDDTKVVDLDSYNDTLFFIKLNNAKNKYIVLGKKDKNRTTASLKKDIQNIVIPNGRFGDKISKYIDQLDDSFEKAFIWRSDIGKWEFVTKDFNTDVDLFFQYEIDGRKRDMPNIIYIFVNEDKDLTIT